MTPRVPSPPAPRPLAFADDDRLVALIRAGHEQAFAELHARHRPSLERLARRLLRGTNHDPEDVLQDAFASAYVSLRAVDRPIALKAWLAMIVRNRAIDYRRQPHASHREPDSERVLTLVPAPGGDPGDVACLREEMRAVVQDIGRLPDRQRLALVRREFEGRPVEEVAAGLGTTLPATWSLLFRAQATVARGRRRRRLAQHPPARSSQARAERSLAATPSAVAQARPGA